MHLQLNAFHPQLHTLFFVLSILFNAKNFEGFAINRANHKTLQGPLKSSLNSVSQDWLLFFKYWLSE